MYRHIRAFWKNESELLTPQTCSAANDLTLEELDISETLRSPGGGNITARYHALADIK